MPGIFGTIHLNELLLDRDLRSRMRGLLRHHPSYMDCGTSTDSSAVGRCTVSYLSVISQSIYNEGKTVTLLTEREASGPLELREEVQLILEPARGHSG